MNFLKKLYRCLFVWNIPPASDAGLAQADAIVTQCCSRMRDGTPGLPNEVLAAVMRSLYEKYKLPMIPQEELAMAAPELSYVGVAGGSFTGLSNFSWNTHTVAKFQLDLCKKNGWKKVIIVTFPEHMGRSVWVYSKLGLEPLPVSAPKIVYSDPGLIHWSCRGGRVRFIFREFFCRLLFLFWGKI